MGAPRDYLAPTLTKLMPLMLLLSLSQKQDIEAEICRCMAVLQLIREEVVKLDEDNKVCRVEIYRHGIDL